MESIPRTTRAQSMDALSSRRPSPGYKAALIAAPELGRFLPMLTTAAGTIARRARSCSAPGWPGCRRSRPRGGWARVVSGFDVRPAVREQVESLGRDFLELDLGGDGGRRAATRAS